MVMLITKNVAPPPKQGPILRLCQYNFFTDEINTFAFCEQIKWAFIRDTAQCDYTERMRAPRYMFSNVVTILSSRLGTILFSVSLEYE